MCLCWTVMCLQSQSLLQNKTTAMPGSWMRRKMGNAAQICRELRHRTLGWLTPKPPEPRQTESRLGCANPELTILLRQGFRAGCFVTALSLLAGVRWFTAYVNHSLDIRPALINCSGPSASRTHCSRCVSFSAPLTTPSSPKSFSVPLIAPTSSRWLEEKEMLFSPLPFWKK